MERGKERKRKREGHMGSVSVRERVWHTGHVNCSVVVGRGVALCARVAKYLGSPSQGTAQGGIVPTDHRAIHQGAGELGRFVEVVLPVAGWLVFSSCRKKQGRGAVRVSLRSPPHKTSAQ